MVICSKKSGLAGHGQGQTKSEFNLKTEGEGEVLFSKSGSTNMKRRPFFMKNFIMQGHSRSRTMKNFTIFSK